MLLAGCGLAPSDPKTPSIALRVDSGTISVIIPDCGNEQIRSAAVYDYDGGSIDSPIWSATEYAGGRSLVVALSDAAWKDASGSYSNHKNIGIEVRTNGNLYGGSATPTDFYNATGLPAGIFYLEGTKVDASGYQKTMEQYPCRSPTATSS